MSLGLSAFTFSACFGNDKEEQKTDGTKGLQYEILGDEAALSGLGKTKETNIQIASSYQGKPVTGVYNGIFDNSGVQSVIFPDSIVGYGFGLFSNCPTLQSVTLSKNANIDDSMFKDCTALTSITIPEGVTSIGDNAFANCSALQTISIPNSIQSIGLGGEYSPTNAFDGCVSLQYTVQDNVNYLGNESNPYLIVASAVSKDITTCVLNDNFKILLDYAFVDCNNLGTVYDNATYIGTASNPNLVLLKAVRENAYFGGEEFYNIHEDTKYIHTKAFSGCSHYKNPVIPHSVTHIGASAFENCQWLTTIRIGASLESIGQEAFSGAQKIEKVILDCTDDKWATIDFGDNPLNGSYMYTFDEKKQIPVAKTGIVLNTATYISEGAYENCQNMVGATISGSVKTINATAFYGCVYFQSLELKEGIVEIGSSAFYNCGFSHVTIPNSVQTIQSNAFENCNDLERVELGTGLTYMGVGVFGNCPLKGMKFGTTEGWSTAESIFSAPNPVDASGLTDPVQAVETFVNRGRCVWERK